MGDHQNQATDFNDPAAHAPDAAAFEKGKGKAAEAHEDVTMEEDDEIESSEDEEESTEEDEDEGHDNLEPISTSNIIDGGRRTRGKRIDFAEAAEKAKAAGEDPMDDDDEEDEDFHGEEGGDDHMQE